MFVLNRNSTSSRCLSNFRDTRNAFLPQILCFSSHKIASTHTKHTKMNSLCRLRGSSVSSSFIFARASSPICPQLLSSNSSLVTLHPRQEAPIKLSICNAHRVHSTEHSKERRRCPGSTPEEAIGSSPNQQESAGQPSALGISLSLAIAGAWLCPQEAQAMVVSLEPSNALSLPTWAIHVSSVLEWVIATKVSARAGS